LTIKISNLNLNFKSLQTMEGKPQKIELIVVTSLVVGNRVGTGIFLLPVT
jgi:hypothetical protein